MFYLQSVKDISFIQQNIAVYRKFPIFSKTRSYSTMVSVCHKSLSESIKYCIIIIFFPFTNMKFGGLHCKYIRPHYDGTLAIHRSTTTIHCRYQLQCSIWKFPIQNGIIYDIQEGQITISKIVQIAI